MKLSMMGVRTLALAIINAHLVVFALYLLLVTSQRPDRISDVGALAAVCLSSIVFVSSVKVERSTPKGVQPFAVAFLLCTTLVYLVAESTVI